MQFICCTKRNLKSIQLVFYEQHYICMTTVTIILRSFIAIIILTDDKIVLLTVNRPEAVITVWEFCTWDMKKVTCTVYNTFIKIHKPISIYDYMYYINLTKSKTIQYNIVCVWYKYLFIFGTYWLNCRRSSCAIFNVY